MTASGPVPLGLALNPVRILRPPKNCSKDMPMHCKPKCSRQAISGVTQTAQSQLTREQISSQAAGHSTHLPRSGHLCLVALQRLLGLQGRRTCFAQLQSKEEQAGGEEECKSIFACPSEFPLLPLADHQCTPFGGSATMRLVIGMLLIAEEEQE